MKRTVYKYGISRSGITRVEMPGEAYIIKAAIQKDNIFIWALVDLEDTDKDYHDFVVLATGEEVDYRLDHIDTIQEGPYMWHVFEVY